VTTTDNALKIVDKHVGYGRGGYRLDIVARDGAGHTVRVRVAYSLMTDGSSAVAEVLAPDMTWTDLATESPSNWHGGVPSSWDNDLDLGRAMKEKELPPELHEGGPAVIAALQVVADRLLDRAAAILA